MSNKDELSEAMDVTETEANALPANRFELELEFVQSLASPAYLHFLATFRVGDDHDANTTILQDPAFIDFLRYLRRTWSRPEYSCFLTYPHSLYFLDMLIEKPAALKEWTLPAFRNFCHQQQFLTWQHRHASLYGHAGTRLQQQEEEDQEPSTADGVASSIL